MKLTDTVQPWVDDGCSQNAMEQAILSNFPMPPTNLVEPGSYGHPIVWLRVAAATRDALKILTNSAAAFHLIRNPVPLLPGTLAKVFGADPATVALLSMFAGVAPLDDGLATAFADLSVTGRAAFASFSAQKPNEINLPSLVTARLKSAGISVTDTQVTPGANMALDRAYLVARALRGSVSERLATRPALTPNWIAVSSEEDPPHRPVNATSAPFPQFEIPVSVPGVPPVVTRFFIASPDPISPGVLAPPDRALPVGDKIAIPNGPHDRVLLFIHGHGSSAEECLSLIHPLQAEGNAAGIRITVIAFDLPNNGYSSMFDHNLVAPSTATTYPGGIFDGEPINVPVLDFIENAIAGFVAALDTHAEFTSRCIGVIGGSLGGNMGLRLGRRPGSNPWLQNGIVAWSPAGVWDPMIRDEIKRHGPDHCRNKWDEAEKVGLPGNSSSRMNYFIETFSGGSFDSDGNNLTETLDTRMSIAGPMAGIGLLVGGIPEAVFLGVTGLLLAPAFATMLGPVQATEWYRDDWSPCNELAVLEGVYARQDVYNTFFRQWNWRVAGEQLIYSHVDRMDHWNSASPWRYELNRVRTLLASGEKDDFMWAHIFQATRTLASLMSQTPGRSLFIHDTGHSIHIERPSYFAREIVSFLTLEAGAASSGAVVSRGQRQLDLFAIGRDGQMLHRSGDGSIWQPPLTWEPLGGNFASPPAATASGPNALDVFAIGLDGQMLHRSWDGANWNASGWLPVGKVFATGGRFILTGTPAVVGRSKMRIDIFVLAMDTVGTTPGPVMLHQSWDSVKWAPDWQNLGGVLASSPAVASWDANRIDVFALGADRQILHKAFDTSLGLQGTGAWESLGGTFSSQPAVVAWAPNRLDVFAVGLQGQMLHKAWNGVAWQPPIGLPLGLDLWDDLGGTFTSAPAAVSWGNNRLDVFALGLGRKMLHKWWDGSAWRPSATDWEDLSTTIVPPATLVETFMAPPIAATWGLNRLDLFDIGVDGQMFHKAMDVSGWLP